MTAQTFRDAPVLIHVQHLLGIGHLRRALALARSLIERGAQVTLVSGGMPVPGLDLPGGNFVQLQPMRAADSSFAKMVDAQGDAITSEFEKSRALVLLDLYKRIKPRVLITELFPLGRRRLRFELIPLLDHAVADPDRPLILSSVRDILVRPSKSGRAEECVRLAKKYYDHILVHSDEALVPLPASFPETASLQSKFAYTGFIVGKEKKSNIDSKAHGEILVSAGGGAEGRAVYDLVLRLLENHPGTAGDRHWRLLIGWNIPESEFEVYQTRAAASGAKVTVERARPDFPDLLKTCDLSISQAGYNTVMEILAAQARAVLIPFSTNSETEQTIRAGLLAKSGRAVHIEPKNLTLDALSKAVQQSLKTELKMFTVNLNGDERTAELVEQWLMARQ